jgi:acyl-CoA synthetase (AMP-forming)/AMP-acid ligase II
MDFGKGLRALWDWKRGDVLGIYAPNCIDTPAIMYGTLWAGGILSPANPAYTAEELALQLKDSGARALCTQLELLPVATKAAAMAGIDKDMIILMGDQRTPDASFKHFTSIRNISGATRYRKAKVKATDLAFLVYSSGTTGLPKGVMLSHQNICSNLLQLGTIESGNLSWKGGPSGAGDRILAFLPFYHIYGKTLILFIETDRQASPASSCSPATAAGSSS